ncbi:hypothetical protein KSP35_07910 [Aquihabitans sp. G128]|uniref:hypothetical protein n=1 Tax=Aquihabitans sp. G128 TaxID=2849779 RepID=UPI001C24A3B1|nr:hypothetical protein [Aquihabitans sp. G128]QXC62706.1 hypothetical protein KSP35_07910 [Aquihabitans sp. G128]
MRQRILAIVGAVALVVVAVFVRSMISDDGSGGSSGDDGGKPVVACTPDLQGICDALEADGRIAADTPALDLADAAAPPAALDGWITWDPAPGIADIDAEQASANKPWDAGAPLGASTLAVAVRGSQLTGAPSGCTQVAFPWTCLDQEASSSAAIGVGTGTTAESLARLYPIALSLVPDADSGFRDIPDQRLQSLVNSPPDGQDPFPDQLRTLQTKVGALNYLVGTTDAFEGAENLTVLTATPVAQATIVLAPRRGTKDLVAGSALTSSGVQQALRDAGVVPGTGRLAPDDRAGDLYAVRDKVG